MTNRGHNATFPASMIPQHPSEPRGINVPSRSLRTACPREKMTLPKVAIILVVLLTAFFVLSQMLTSEARLNVRLLEWSTAYHLTDPQVSRIRQLERAYHGNGLPFTGRGSRSAADENAHHREISLAMNPDDAARFLKVMEENDGCK